MSSHTAKLEGVVSLDTSGFHGALAQASVAATKFSEHLKDGVGELGKKAFEGVKDQISEVASALGVQGLMGVGAWIEGAKGATEFADSLSKISSKTGIASSDLIKLQEVFRTAGLDINSAVIFIKKMEEAIADPNKSDFFKDLGIPQGQLDSMKSANDEFIAILGNVAKLKSESLQNFALGNIFGPRNGIQLKSIVKDKEAFSNADRNLGGLTNLFADKPTELQTQVGGGTISAKTVDGVKNEVASTLEYVNDYFFENIPVKIRQMYLAVVVGAKDSLKELADFVSGLDFSGFGSSLGKNLSEAFNLIKGLFEKGDIFSFLGKSIKLAFLESISIIATTFQSLFRTSFSAEAFKPIALFFEGVGYKFTAIIKSGFADILSALPSMLRNDDRIQTLKDSSSMNSGLGSDLISNAGRSAIQAYVNFVPSFLKNFKDIQEGGNVLTQKGGEIPTTIGSLSKMATKAGQPFSTFQQIQLPSYTPKVEGGENNGYERVSYGYSPSIKAVGGGLEGSKANPLYVTDPNAHALLEDLHKNNFNPASIE